MSDLDVLATEIARGPSRENCFVDAEPLTAVQRELLMPRLEWRTYLVKSEEVFSK